MRDCKVNAEAGDLCVMINEYRHHAFIIHFASIVEKAQGRIPFATCDIDFLACSFRLDDEERQQLLVLNFNRILDGCFRDDKPKLKNDTDKCHRSLARCNHFEKVKISLDGTFVVLDQNCCDCNISSFDKRFKEFSFDHRLSLEEHL